MIDLTMHNDEDLVDTVINDEFLESEMNEPGFMDLIEELFIFTYAQKQELLEYLSDD